MTDPRGDLPDSSSTPIKRNSRWPNFAYNRHLISPRNLLLLILLLLIIVSGSLFTQHFWQTKGSFSASITQKPAGIGPFAGPPLDTKQIAALHLMREQLGYKQLASLYVARMSLDEELGQLIMVEYNDDHYSPDLDTMLHQLHAGGVIMYEFQMKTAAQTRQDIAQMQTRSKLPLLISTDEEGGIVHRLSNIYPPHASALSIYQSGSLDFAAQQGHLVAHDLLSLGINTNLAPDVDVALVPDAPDQITRTFGFTTSSVIQYAGAYMRAMQSDNVIACIKHFPGLGAATVDAHQALPVIQRTRDQIYATELVPFKHFVQTTGPFEQPGLVMPTDVLMPAIDPAMPAELSHTFITDILRKEFGYDGVILTDALYMQGVQINGQSVSMPEAAVMALNAGDDMLLGPTGTEQMEEMLAALKTAYEQGKLSKARIDEAATRIIALKIARHLMPAIPPL